MLVNKTLGYLKDGNKDFAVDNFLHEVNENMKNSRDNDKQLHELFVKVFLKNEQTKQPEENAEKEEALTKEEEFKYTVRRLELQEDLKTEISKLWDFFVDYKSNNKFQAQEKILKFLDNKSSANQTSNVDNIYINNVLNVIQKKIAELKKIKPERIEKDEEELDILFNRVKVELLLVKAQIYPLARLLKRKLVSPNDLKYIEFDQTEKAEMIENLLAKKEYFYDLVAEYIRVKPIAYKKTVVLNEDIIRSLEDSETLFGYKKLEEYSQKAQEYVVKMHEQYYKNKKSPSLNNLAYLKENLNLDLNKEIVNFAKIRKSENDLDYIETILKNYKNILTNLDKKSITGAHSSNHINLNYYPKKLDKQARLIIANKNNKVNSDHFSNLLLNFTKRNLYHNLMTLGKLKDPRERNIIKTLLIYDKKNNKERNLVNFINLKSINNLNSNIYSHVLKELNNLQDSIKDKREDNVYLDAILNHVYKTNEIVSETYEDKIKDIPSKKQETVKLGQLRDVMGQSYDSITVNHAIQMILFGVENNFAEAIRLGEKICSDFNFVLPPWIETAVNKYLIKHSEEYSETVSKIGPVNAASVYRKDISKKDILKDLTLETPYDAYKSPLSVCSGLSSTKGSGRGFRCKEVHNYYEKYEFC